MKTAREKAAAPAAKLPAGMTGRYEFLMNRPAQGIREMTEESLATLNITPKQYGILAAIRFEGAATQKSIGDMLKIDRTTMVLLVDDLEEKGLVLRDDHPDDRRYYLLHLTASGREAFREAHRLVLKVESRFLGPLTRTERQDLRKCLSKLFYSIASQSA